MAIDETEGSESEEPRSGSDRFLQNVSAEAGEDSYGWTNFRQEFHDGGRFDRSRYLGFDPQRTDDYLEDGASAAKTLNQFWESYLDLETTAVRKDEYGWEHFKREYYYERNDRPPRDGDGNKIPFDPSEYLGFDGDNVVGKLSEAESIASDLFDTVDERTVDVNDDLDEDAFFSTVEGYTTVVNRYDLEKAVPMEKKEHFYEIERYWVNKPYACVVIFHSRKENERKYYAIQPYMNEIEMDLEEFIAGKLRTAIKYSDDDITVEGSEADRAQVIQEETEKLLKRYDLYSGSVDSGAGGSSGGTMGKLKQMLGMGGSSEDASGELEGISVRPEPIVLEEDRDTLTEYEVEKLLYELKRDFIGYARIDPIKHDINVEDISCDGYNTRVFVYHTEYENIISNIEHGEKELDDFVVKLSQRSGKGISKRQPQVDATLPDGSRAQLTLGDEVSDHGTNYTIRQFKDVPFTPIDLINWNTFSLDQMAFLWLCIENHKSLIFAGGTASGKTTSLNAVSLFIPSNSKIVSIEDTREVELPQRNWVASVTRPSFGEDDKGDVDEFDLLEAALRQRPDYIVMGEIRGEEGRTLFQVMSTGHTTYTTFHADSVGEVIKRFTTEPINVSKTLFTALDLVSIQTQTRTDGNKVRRSKSLTEINEYAPENDEINVRDVYQWQAETDKFIQMGNSNTLEEIKFDRGWQQDRLDEELFKRQVVLAYLIENGLNTYTQVAATIQAFINDPDTIMTLIANDQLERSLEDLREMESVQIEVDEDKEEMVPRPDPGDEMRDEAQGILENADPLFEQLREGATSDIVSALTGMEQDETDVMVSAEEADASTPSNGVSTASDDGATDDEGEESIEFGQFVPKAGAEGSEDS